MDQHLLRLCTKITSIVISYQLALHPLQAISNEIKPKRKARTTLRPTSNHTTEETWHENSQLPASALLNVVSEDRAQILQQSLAQQLPHGVQHMPSVTYLWKLPGLPREPLGHGDVCDWAAGFLEGTLCQKYCG
jgi:hypothetical protein